MDVERAEAKFLRVSSGIVCFARVGLDFVPNATGSARIRFAMVEPDRNHGEVDERSAPAWAQAAREGVEQALSILELDPARVVSITKLAGTIVDTTEDSVRCAAGLATAQLFGREIAISDARPWRLVPSDN